MGRKGGGGGEGWGEAPESDWTKKSDSKKRGLASVVLDEHSERSRSSALRAGSMPRTRYCRGAHWTSTRFN